MPPLILASSSPYRRELLARLQLPFSVQSPNIDESPQLGEAPEHTALRLAQAKARKVAETFPNALIIGCDQVATLDGLQLGKPLTHDNAVRQLTLMRGRSVVFHSALCVYNALTQEMQADVVPYTVKFRDLSDRQIESYLQKEQPYQCAGSAKSEGLGIAIIAAMQGDDPNALIGLPLIRLIDMLASQGVDVI
ncbi:Maf family protein [Methylobacillus flagellatus]|uniref:7-methyl-GTP pyrophosphatase n=1 Tax=Methylobacillus flagellatus (strain ATCC 51484 / DSM 6875 / VKM B-1610 / KT) TaxID=265072 RepID=NTPPB_METFK|nr:Maf family nucleotide pyrophosphatase [Methylobacillus flagellatus]Q1H156.1 RecName: Full=7-methyl-GTP pyrophosphatase; Short=m(7)GTP pyrophosphatase [Methylobacillus flagellatus KT]ABE49781.1 maf protein [Methylobacillus flagellatus KT]